MECVINQPSYLPWRGYFHQIRKADLFVFFDDVQYTKRSWRNRNRITGPAGTRWLTIPVHAHGAITQGIPIHRIRIDWTTDWARSHREKIKQFYRKAPFYRRYEPLLDSFYSRRPERLADFVIDTTVELARELGIRDTRFVRSSELGIPGRGFERVLAILREVGATHFVNGPTAREYTDDDRLAEAGITVEYMSYEYPPYPQNTDPFDPQLSILDLMFMTGDDAPAYIWGQGS
jgi:hypothetical protein